MQYEVVASGLRFPEGPIAMPDGSILLVEIERGTVSRVGVDGKVAVVADLGGGPNGLAIGPDGRCYVCNNGGMEWHERDGMLIPGHQPDSYRGGSIQAVDLATGTVETLYTHCEGEPLKAPNDLVFGRHGGFWFTDNGKRRPRTEDVGAVYYAKADGSFISEQVYPCSHANGVGLSPDEKWLYVAETMVGRVWRYHVQEPGRAVVPAGLLNGESLLYGAPGFDLYDSLAVEECGNICVATLARGGITVIDPQGHLVEHVPLPDPGTTNICFGGRDRRTAYVTLGCMGQLVKLDWPRPGLALNFSPE